MLQGVKALVTVGMLAVEDKIPPPAHVTTDGPTRPGLLFLATITNSLQTPYKKEKSLYHGERLPNHPFLVHQLINKEIKSMLSPKILIELLK